MTRRPRPSSRRPRSGATRRGPALVALVLVVAACSGGGDAGGGGPVPTLLTAPMQPTTTSTSTTTTSTSTTVPPATGQATTPVADPVATTGGSDTAPDAGTDAGTESTAGRDESTSTAATSPDGSTETSSTPVTTVPPTSTTHDIEPPPPSISTTTTTPIPTAAPPDTIGGRETDFLLGPRSIAGLQFGASRTTVLDRLRPLLGDPMVVAELDHCPDGPALALQWFNAAVILTDRGLAYYLVGMNLDTYGDRPIPNWRTAGGVRVGDGRAQLDAVYPGQVAYDPPSGLVTSFTITGSADAGMTGRLEGDVLASLSAGTTTC